MWRSWKAYGPLPPGASPGSIDGTPTPRQSGPSAGPGAADGMRLFVALRFPESVRMAIRDATASLRGTGLSVRWTPVEQLHITLRFLGDVDLPGAAGVGERLAEAARECGPFDLPLGGVGAFPSMRRPRVVWLGAGPSTGITALHRSVETAVGECGFKPEGRPFRPHITLGRVRPPRRGSSPPADPAELARLGGAIEFRTEVSLTHLYLMESRLGANGARHTVRGSYPLLGEPVLPTGS
jgi:2'-5' RNA ligase